MDNALLRQINQHLDMDFIVQTLVRLLQVPTNVPEGSTFMEPDDPKLVYYVQSVVRPILSDLGYEGMTIDRLNNLILRSGAGRSGKRLLIMAYTPAQHANQMKDPFSGKITNAGGYGYDEPCAFGQGASQNKGALAAVLGALKLLRDAGVDLAGELIFALNNEGRSSHACSMEIIDGQEIYATDGILAIGTANKIALGNRGRVDVLITVQGKACHSSQPWRGLNAIEGARQALNRLAEISLTASHPRLGRAQLTVYQVIFSPIAPHTLPDVGRLTVDRRLMPGEDPEAAVAEIAYALGDMSPYGLRVEQGVFMYPAEVPVDHEVVQALQEGLTAVRGRPAETDYPQWTFDAGYACSRGIPTVMFGPSCVDPAGEDLLGADFVALSQVEEAAKAYAYAILRLLG